MLQTCAKSPVDSTNCMQIEATNNNLNYTLSITHAHARSIDRSRRARTRRWKSKIEVHKSTDGDKDYIKIHLFCCRIIAYMMLWSNRLLHVCMCLWSNWQMVKSTGDLLPHTGKYSSPDNEYNSSLHRLDLVNMS